MNGGLAGRRADLLEDALAALRGSLPGFCTMPPLLGVIGRALRVDGAALLDLRSVLPSSVVRHETAALPPAVLEAALATLHDSEDGQVVGGVTPACGFLAFRANTRLDDEAALLAWRNAGPAFDSDDQALAGCVANAVRLVLEQEAMQRELALQARTDALTGLLNRNAFIEETRRRIDRLDREGLPGTLMLLDLDGFAALNDQHGQEAGDAVLFALAGLLRRTVRPSDLVARIGGDTFAVWLDGSDELTAAERADALGEAVPRLWPAAPPLTLSTGIVCRSVGSAEELDLLLRRADLALHDAKRTGVGQWRVYQPGDAR